MVKRQGDSRRRRRVTRPPECGGASAKRRLDVETVDDQLEGPGPEVLAQPHTSDDGRDDGVLRSNAAQCGACVLDEYTHGSRRLFPESPARRDASLGYGATIIRTSGAGLNGRGLNDVVRCRLAVDLCSGLGDPAHHRRECSARMPDERAEIPLTETRAAPCIAGNRVDHGREPLSSLEECLYFSVLHVFGVHRGDSAFDVVPLVHAASVSPHTDYAGVVEELPQREPAVREVPYLNNVENLARRLSAEPAWCWLDGGFDTSSSWSYLGAATEVRTANRGTEAQFLEELEHAGNRHTLGPERARTSGFFGGWVLALGYEFGVALMGIDPAPDDTDPAFAIRLDVVLAMHHATRRAELRGTDVASLDAWWQRYSDAWGEGHAGVEHADAAVPTVAVRQAEPSSPSNAFWRQSDEGYVEQVVACTEHIVDGEAYVLCLTDTATLHAVSVDPLALYLRVREGGGATRGAVIVADDRALVSASPERFLSLTGQTLATHPIKGTRPRVADPESDRRLAEQLAADAKERAENLMIVDLMRNDLSKVCEPGTVRVDGFLRVESHPHVHQLVSTVSGELRAGLSLADAIAAAFPGGSMTGAPKHRAIEILAELEGAPRGLYSGCFGWLDDRGDAELAMTIRSVELRARADLEAHWEARIGAGGGITADSDPESELREKHLKAAPLLKALGATAL